MAGETQAEIAIACFPGFQATTVHGLTDLFSYANHFAVALGKARMPPLRVRHWHQAPGTMAIECSFESHPGTTVAPRVVVVPASHLAPMAPGSAAGFLPWIRARHAEGAFVAAVCGGVFLLAESGLLAGRRATTHWMFAEELARRFPDIRLDPDRLVIDDGEIITAGGVLAWANLGLIVVERLLGPSVMVATARFMLADPAGKEQRFYAGFTPRLQHGDRAILAIQHWMQTQTGRPTSVAELAGRAVLGERTFLRRFLKATGLTPIEYHQRLRILRSQEMLEHTRDAVDHIAALVGYGDPAGFRRLFKRIVGLSPSEYRRRFGHAEPVAGSPRRSQPARIASSQTTAAAAPASGVPSTRSPR